MDLLDNTLSGINEICLADTFGGLRYNVFEQIINERLGIKSDDEKSIVESINSVKSKNPFDKIINKFKKSKDKDLKDLKDPKEL